MPLDTLARVKQATAYIRTDDDGQEKGAANSGSGFVIRSDGTTGYIVTNAHVVDAPGRRGRCGPADRQGLSSGAGRSRKPRRRPRSWPPSPGATWRS